MGSEHENLSALRTARDKKGERVENVISAAKNINQA